MSDSNIDTTPVLIIANLIITSIVAVVTTMRCRFKCGDNMMTCKPKDTAYSPGSDIETGDRMPKNAVAVVIDDK